MHFRIDLSRHQASNGILIYRPNEYSFAVVPTPSNGFTSVLLDDLNLEVNEVGKVISVWGMCPHTRWTPAILTPPDAPFGDIFFVPDVPLSRGISLRLNRDGYLPVRVDPKSGWMLIQAPGKPVSSVKLLSGVIFEISEEGLLCAIWLRPLQEDDNRALDIGQLLQELR
jgi:hypothetical protein